MNIKPSRFERVGYNFDESISDTQRLHTVLLELVAEFLHCAETGIQPSLELRANAKLEMWLWGCKYFANDRSRLGSHFATKNSNTGEK